MRNLVWVLIILSVLIISGIIYAVLRSEKSEEDLIVESLYNKNKIPLLDASSLDKSNRQISEDLINMTPLEIKTLTSKGFLKVKTV